MTLDLEALMDLNQQVFDWAYSLDAAPKVMGRLAEILDCPAFHLRVFQSNYEFIYGYHHGFDNQLLERFGSYYARLDPLNKYVVENPRTDYIYTFADLYRFDTNFADYRKQEFYRDFAVPQNIYCPAGFSLCLGGGRRVIGSLLRHQGQNEHSSQDLQCIKALLPSMQKALDLNWQFQQLKLHQQALEETLGNIRWGAMVFDGEGKLIYRNERASALLREYKTLSINNGHLSASDPWLDQQLRARLSAPPGQSRFASGDLKVPADDWNAPPLMLRVLGIEEQPWDLDFLGYAPGTIILLGHPRTLSTLSPERLRLAYGLTKTEAKLACALALGLDLKAYSQQAGVTHETARGQLKQVFAKTDCSSQNQLVALIQALP